MKLPKNWRVIIAIIAAIHVVFIIIINLDGIIPISNSLQQSQSIEQLEQINKSLFLLNQELKTINQTFHHLVHSKKGLHSSNLRSISINNAKITSKPEGITAVSAVTNQPEIILVPSASNPASNIPKSALIFTMDSISSYEENSLHGGASGEITIRHSLEDAFKYYKIKCDVMKSDQEFESKNLKEYDIILLDLQMPVLDGLEMMKRIRQLEAAMELTSRLQHIVIGMSANSDHETSMSAYEVGVDAFLPKPFKVETFRTTLSNLMMM